MKNKLLLAVLLLMAGSLAAQNFNDALRLSEKGLGSNARALGMGNAYTAIGNDVAGMYFNPAGIGQVTRMEVAGSISYSMKSIENSLYGTTTSADESTMDLSSFGMVIPYPTMRGSLVFGLGYNQNKTFNEKLSYDAYNSSSHSFIQNLVDYNDYASYFLYLSNGDNADDQTTKINGNLQQYGDIKKEGSINSWAFSGALEAARNVFLGVTFNVYTGYYKSVRTFNEDDVNDIYGSDLELVDGEPQTAGFNSFTFKDVIDWDISGWDIKLGLLYKINNNHNFALSFKSPTYYSIVEKYSSYGESNFETYGWKFNPEQDRLEYDINTPMELTAGYSFNYNKHIISVSANYVDYSSMEFSGGLDDAFTRDDLNSEIEDIMRSVINLNAGFEINLVKINTRLRGGFIYMPTPYKDDPYDYNKKIITAGIGFLPGPDSSIDIAYSYGWWENAVDNYGASAESRNVYDANNSRIVVNFSFRY